MVAADGPLGLDHAACAERAARELGGAPWVSGLRLAAMALLRFAVFAWPLTLSKALLCRFVRGSR